MPLLLSFHTASALKVLFKYLAEKVKTLTKEVTKPILMLDVLYRDENKHIWAITFAVLADRAFKQLTQDQACWKYL